MKWLPNTPDRTRPSRRADRQTNAGRGRTDRAVDIRHRHLSRRTRSAQAAWGICTKRSTCLYDSPETIPAGGSVPEQLHRDLASESKGGKLAGPRRLTGLEVLVCKSLIQDVNCRCRKATVQSGGEGEPDAIKRVERSVSNLRHPHFSHVQSCLTRHAPYRIGTWPRQESRSIPSESL